MNSIYKEAWVVFTKGEHWTTKFLKKGFGHCYLLINDGFNWIKVDPRNMYLDIEIVCATASTDIPRLLQRGGPHDKIIKVSWWTPRKSYIVKPVHWISCVGVLKYILGVSKFIFTPYGLYKYLLKIQKHNSFGFRHEVKVIW